MRYATTIFVSIIATIVICSTAVALTPHTSTGNFTSSDGEADWDAFEWVWSSRTEAIDVNFSSAVTDGNVILRVFKEIGKSIALEAGPFTVTGSTNATIVVTSTNIPVFASYYAEIAQVQETDPVQYKSLARGTIAREWSAWDTTNFIGTTTSVQLAYTYGTNNTANWDEAYDWTAANSNLLASMTWVASYVSTTAVSIAVSNLTHYTLSSNVTAEIAAAITNVDAVTLDGYTAADLAAPSVVYYMWGSLPGDIVIGTATSRLAQTDSPAAESLSDRLYEDITNGWVSAGVTIKADEAPDQLNEGILQFWITTLRNRTAAARTMKAIATVYESDGVTVVASYTASDSIEIPEDAMATRVIGIAITNTTEILSQNRIIHVQAVAFEGWNGNEDLHFYSQDGALTRILLPGGASGVFQTKSDAAAHSALDADAAHGEIDPTLTEGVSVTLFNGVGQAGSGAVSLIFDSQSNDGAISYSGVSDTFGIGSYVSILSGARIYGGLFDGVTTIGQGGGSTLKIDTATWDVTTNGVISGVSISSGDGYGLTNLPVTGLAIGASTEGQVPTRTGSTVAWATPAIDSYLGTPQNLGVTNTYLWAPTRFACDLAPTSAYTFAINPAYTNFPGAVYHGIILSTNTITLGGNMTRLGAAVTPTGTNLFTSRLKNDGTGTNWWFKMGAQ